MFAVSLLIVGVLVLYFGTKDMPVDQQQDVALAGKIHQLPNFNRTALEGGKYSLLHRLKGQEGLQFRAGEHVSSGSPLALSEQDLKQLSKLSQQEQLLQLIQRLLKINELEKMRQDTTAAPTTPAPLLQGNREADEAQRLIEALLRAIQGSDIQVPEQSKLEMASTDATSQRRPAPGALDAGRGDAPAREDQVPPQDQILQRLRGMNLPINLRK